MEYGKIENDNVIFLTDKYITIKREVTYIDKFTKEKVTTTREFKVFNPTQEQILEQGWHSIEYINEVGESKIEDNKLKIYTGREYTRSIDDAKHLKLIQIDSYDSSPAVNSFYYGEQKLWIDKATRVGLVNAINSEIALGAETITFGIQGISVTLPCQRALLMLYLLERYALKCYNVTLAHKNVVDNLTTIEEVDNYNYIEGYPDKLRFEV